MNKIRLLYVSSSLNNGHELNFLGRLSADERLDVTVASSNQLDCLPEIRKLPVRLFFAKGLPARFKFRPLTALCNKLNNAFFQQMIRRILSRQSIDIIHSGWLTQDSYLALRTGFHPVLAMAWGSDVLPDPFVVNAHQSRRVLKKLRFTAGHADTIYCDCRAVAETLCTLTGVAPEKLRIFLQLGVETAVFRPDAALAAEARREWAVAPKTNVLIMTRRLDPAYGVADYLHALALLRNRVACPFLAVLAGEGSLEGQLKELTRDLGLQDSVVFVGAKPRQDLPRYLNGADLYVSTSLSDGTSISLLEAMSCGLPVVVTDVPANLEWVRDGYNGAVAARGDPQSIAQALQSVLEDPAKRALFRERNRALALERIEASRNYETLVDLYRALVAAHAASGASGRC
ncbi:MAG: hypothetical protein A3K19_12955 [Lentisphaerae bacterium RIFOXYB12_FULL_65_16]|nr:MAG: hypothetical protein A3K18_04750 [Lentisphaerae bacterium RIFOXYA12_64_32]OGV87221.1 MAG: hypothetical protein A3K19_12955 [Lentisphaerae bacterium RIFOXYB12_FULL_65_16]